MLGISETAPASDMLVDNNQTNNTAVDASVRFHVATMDNKHNHVNGPFAQQLSKIGDFSPFGHSCCPKAPIGPDKEGQALLFHQKISLARPFI